MILNNRILNRERLPSTGCVVIAGHLTGADLPVITQLFSGRRITWLIEENSMPAPDVAAQITGNGTGAAFSKQEADPASAGSQLKQHLEGGGVIIFIHGHSQSRSGNPVHIAGDILSTLGKFGLPVLPLGIDHPREAALSIERVSTLPRLVLSVGSLIPAAEVSGAAIRQGLLAASEEAFASRSLFSGSLATAVLQGLKKNRKVKLCDGSDDSEITFGRLLGAALVFSKHLREETDNKRVGIILPPGKAGMLANLAVLFAGKTPVNFNFTASHDAVTSAMRQSGLDCYITADPFVRKVSSFPWPPNRELIYIERALPALKKKIIAWVILAGILPAALLRSLFSIGKMRGDDEAVLLFTSGSSGEPKGVVLTHRNILGNISQFAPRLGVGDADCMLGSLPLFHSFGSTVTLWYPCIEGVKLVTYPNPLDVKRLGQLIQQHQVNLLLATPTFLRGYMKRVTREQLASLRLLVTGAEKLPRNFAETFAEHFGIEPQEGYGLTETSPVTNVNLPNLPETPGRTTLPSARPGSVGKLIPGLALRLTNPVSGMPCRLDEQGIIWFKGVNIFRGYLNNKQKTSEVLTRDGWFQTGDVGRMDEDGFLYIEGRMSRFSKIAGEMVPHETIEAAVNRAMGLDAESERKVAVVGIPDPQKGEAIVLLSTIAGRAVEQECIDLRYKLMDAGLPSLWCPKTIIPVEEIPVLASGKLDLKGCQMLAGG